MPSQFDLARWLMVSLLKCNCITHPFHSAQHMQYLCSGLRTVSSIAHILKRIHFTSIHILMHTHTLTSPGPKLKRWKSDCVWPGSAISRVHGMRNVRIFTYVVWIQFGRRFFVCVLSIFAPFFARTISTRSTENIIWERLGNITIEYMLYTMHMSRTSSAFASKQPWNALMAKLLFRIRFVADDEARRRGKLLV